MRRSLLSLLTLLGSAGGATLLHPTAAHAGYDWEGPGTMCRPLKADVSKIDYSGILAFNSSTTASAKVACPIPYESITLNSDNPIPIPTVEVVYLDRSPSASRVQCTLLLADLTGTTVLSQTLTSPGANSALQSFDFFGLRKSMLGFAELTVTCTLPLATSSSTRSGIRALRFFSQ